LQKFRRLTDFDQPTLSDKHLCGQLPAALAGHRALDTLNDGRDRAAIIFELLGAVLNRDARLTADVLVVSAVVGVLEATPAADVTDMYGCEVGFAGLSILDQAFKGVTAVEP
jgi:hypothetical protein